MILNSVRENLMSDPNCIVRPSRSFRRIKIEWNSQAGAYVNGRAPPKIQALVTYLHRDDLELLIPPPPVDPNNRVYIQPGFRVGAIEKVNEFYDEVIGQQTVFNYTVISTTEELES